MTDRIFVVGLVLVLTPVIVWTTRVQKRHDSLAVILSAVALFISAVPQAVFAITVVGRVAGAPGGVPVPPFLLAGASACSLFLGPVLITLAFWSRRGEYLPRSTLLLQVVHSGLWAILTFFDVGMTLDV